jgi:hypothetical protein
MGTCFYFWSNILWKQRNLEVHCRTSCLASSSVPRSVVIWAARLSLLCRTAWGHAYIFRNENKIANTWYHSEPSCIVCTSLLLVCTTKQQFLLQSSWHDLCIITAQQEFAVKNLMHCRACTTVIWAVLHTACYINLLPIQTPPPPCETPREMTLTKLIYVLCLKRYTTSGMAYQQKPEQWLIFLYWLYKNLLCSIPTNICLLLSL